MFVSNRSIFLKSQDVVLAMIMMGRTAIPQKEIARISGLSPSEVSNGIYRLKKARLLDGNSKVMKSNLCDFLVHGVPHAFPATIDYNEQLGIPTSHSYMDNIMAGYEYVWPQKDGQLLGRGVSPLHPSAVVTSLQNSKCHQLLANIDALRVGRAREKSQAIDLLRKKLK